MFNNDMNNNQNFNNGNAMFNNISNNNFLNNNAGQETPMFNNVQNNSFVQPWQMQSQSQQPIFTNEEFNPYGYVPNNSIGQTADVPPDLGEITNLNDATVASAPTMDVLGPMNIMPETLPPKNDPLDAYENGTLNMNANSFIQPEQNFNVFNQPASYQSSSAFNPTMQNVVTNQNVGINYNNNQSFNTQVNNPNVSNNGFDVNNSVDFQNNFNMEYQQPKVSAQESFNTDYQPNSSIIDLLNKKYEIPSSMSSYSNDTNNKYSVSSNDDNTLNTSLDAFRNTQMSTKEDAYKNEEKEKVDIPEVQELSDINTEEVQAIQKDELDEQPIDDALKEEDKLSDLGLDESYSESDTLEIMDLDTDSETITEESTDETTPKELVSDNVKKIRSLVEELKLNGADIEIEEFDFETMYQLIVKLNK